MLAVWHNLHDCQELEDILLSGQVVQDREVRLRQWYSLMDLIDIGEGDFFLDRS